MTAPAAVSWAAHLGRLDLAGTWLAFMGSIWTSLVLTLLALAELVTDQLPSTPSRTVPVQFGAACARRVVGRCVGSVGRNGADCRAAAGDRGRAVIGTLGGRAFRVWLATAFGSDRPAAFIEDAVAIVGALLIGIALP